MYAQKSWKREKNSGYLYRALSDQESGTPRQLLFLELANEADQQAELWATEIRKAGGTPPAHYVHASHIIVLTWLIRTLGPHRVKPVLRAMKIRGLAVYSNPRLDANVMPDPATRAGTNLGSNGLRTVVFGINDGLVSIALLVMGVAGATSQRTIILLTGVAGLLAGASAMAAGDWISMRSRRDVLEYRIGPEPAEDAQYPVEETRELALIYQARGMVREDALALARRRMHDDLEEETEPAVPRPARPDTTIPGSPWQAMALSFFAFVFGGLIPLLPYLLELQRHALLNAVCLSCVALFAVGATVSWLSGRQALWGGFRMVAIAGLSGATAYFTGGLLGAKIG